jgi:hypothetical protein
MAPKKMLIGVSSDPRRSARPGEAVRIAAGVGAWKKVQVSLHFSGEAVRCLFEDAEELVNGEFFSHYLPLIGEQGGSLLVASSSPLLDRINPALKFETVDANQLSEIISEHHCSYRF